MISFIKREFDYALRICAYLAGNFNRKPIPLSAISRKLFITRAIAHKIVHQLKKSDIIKTVQGKQGGIFLNRPPDQLSIFDVLQAMGFNATLNECVRKPQICPLVVTCKIHLFFIEQEEDLINRWKSHKIAEFAFSDEDLALKTASS